ncbi:MAG: Mut7-C RNAse domain-containing protein [Omnitrophica WOR_2 bacterium]
MNSAVFHFFGNLNDFLPPDRRNVDYLYSFEENPSVKHLFESLGVPHIEVDQIRVNGIRVDYSYQVQNSDRVEVFPLSSDRAINENGLLTKIEGEPRFILDNHLGRLAAYLRMLGLDTLYKNDYQDEELALVANRERRVLLTRDRRLLMRNAIIYGYYVRSQFPKDQLVEVVQRYQLVVWIKPFQRCLHCNTPLENVNKEKVLPRLEPLTKQYFNEFHICPNCQKIYWKGSHYERMLKLVQQTRHENGSGSDFEC